MFYFRLSAFQAPIKVVHKASWFEAKWLMDGSCKDVLFWSLVYRKGVGQAGRQDGGIQGQQVDRQAGKQVDSRSTYRNLAIKIAQHPHPRSAPHVLRMFCGLLIILAFLLFQVAAGLFIQGPTLPRACFVIDTVRSELHIK